MSDQEQDQQAHAERMRALKSEQQRKQRESRPAERGLLLVHTGNGKGKSTAAFGVIARALGWGQQVAVVQFIKGDWATGERAFFDRLGIEWHTMGAGFTWDTQDRARDIACATAAWEQSLALIRSGDHDLVVLDEINVALDFGYLDANAVLAGLDARSVGTSVILTGRGAPEALRDAADLVTEMTEIKHPYNAGIQARRGIDF